MPPPKSSSKFCLRTHSPSSSRARPPQPPSPSHSSSSNPPSPTTAPPKPPVPPTLTQTPPTHPPRRPRPLLLLRPGPPTSSSPRPPQLLQAGGDLLQLLLCQRRTLSCAECRAPATGGQASWPRGFLGAAGWAGAALVGSGRAQAVPGEAGLQLLLQLLQLGLLPPRRLILQLLLEVS